MEGGISSTTTNVQHPYLDDATAAILRQNVTTNQLTGGEETE